MVEQVSLTFLRSLSFGGLVGGAVSGLLYLLFPNFFSQYISLYRMVLFGALFGACIHRVFDAIVLKGILYPIGKTLGYYKKIVELQVQVSQGWISIEHASRLKEYMDEEYFLDRPLNNSRSTRPALDPPGQKLKDPELD